MPRKAKKKREITVKGFTFEVEGGRFTVKQLKGCLYGYLPYLEFCKKKMVTPISPLTFLFLIVSQFRKSEYGKRKLIRQLQEKMGLFPFLFWIDIRTAAYRATSVDIAEAYVEKQEEKPSTWFGRFFGPKI